MHLVRRTRAAVGRRQGLQLVTEFAPEDRDEPIEFDSELSDGTKITAADYQGKVAVINFWYAACVPCRMEATDLQAVSEEVAEDAAFLGVNVRDQPDTADAFTRQFNVTYPTAIDVNTGSVQLAFAGKTAPTQLPRRLFSTPRGVSALAYSGRSIRPSCEHSSRQRQRRLSDLAACRRCGLLAGRGDRLLDGFK